MNPRGTSARRHKAPASEVLVIGTGFYVPLRVLDNAELARISGKSTAWIEERTGVLERRRAAPGEQTSDMAYHAACRACESAGIAPADVDIIIVATVTGETHFPATACWLQGKLGNSKAIPLDINMGCAGFMYALSIARALLIDRGANYALVIGADRVTGIADYTDPRSCILFGDGAGAVVLQLSDPHDAPQGLLDAVFFSDPEGASLITRPLDAHSSPDAPAGASQGASFMYMDGPDVYKRAVRGMEEAVRAVVRQAGLALANIDWVVPHQANARIIEAVGERLGLRPTQVFQNIARYGNTSAATIPICLAEMQQQSLLRNGQRIVLCAFGTGLVWAGSLLVWGAR
jgi:3-oxoacyl-[acyl-carrier-protein] synthase-3